jgi:hypothetical protein
MFRRYKRFFVWTAYVVASVATICSLAIDSHLHPSYLWLLAIIVFIGFISGSAELYLLKRGPQKIIVSNNDTSHEALVFVRNEDAEALRISFLSLKHLRGDVNVTVLCSPGRGEVRFLCDEFGFGYVESVNDIHVSRSNVLITNGHTIIYPDALLVAARRLSTEISYVELNHSVYSSHALGNNDAETEISRATLISQSLSTYSIPYYTGGPIFIRADACDFSPIVREDQPISHFADAIARVLSHGVQGTITSHACCECMSDDEIDHNISSRINRIMVARQMRAGLHGIGSFDTIVRRFIAVIATKMSWVRPWAMLLTGGFIIASTARLCDLTKISWQSLVAFIFAQSASFFISRMNGDRRKIVNRLHDRLFECEAYLHTRVSGVRRSHTPRHHVKFNSAFLIVLQTTLALRLYLFIRHYRYDSTKFLSYILSVALAVITLVAIYRALKRYLSARQRAFARRQVSITGSSSYEPMWIVDLTHRGAAYISDQRLDVGDETPLVFRVPTIDGDSLITVVGKVTYCGPSGDAYQVGVAFKELSQEALDQLILYCSILYPFNQVRNVDDEEHIVETVEKAPVRGQRNMLSFAIAAFIIFSLLSLGLSVLPISQGKSVAHNSHSSGVVASAFSSQSGLYDIRSLSLETQPDSLGATLASTLFWDDNANGIQDHGEAGMSGVHVSLYNASDKLITVRDGRVDKKGGEFVTTNENGLYSFSNISTGTYYLTFTQLPASSQFSINVKTRSRAWPTLNGYRSANFTLSSHQKFSASQFALGFVRPFDLRITQEIVDRPGNGFAQGDFVHVKVTARNDGPNPARAGYRVNELLPSGLDPDSVEMIVKDGFSPCSFDGSRMQCVSTQPLDAGQSKDIEFRVKSNLLPSALSDARMLVATIDSSPRDRAETQLASASASNNSDSIVVPVSGSTSIGDRVFFDANANGIADAGEPGIAGVQVSLHAYEDINGDGVRDPGEDPEVARDTTDARGYFGASRGASNFENLDVTKQYSIVFSSLPKELVAEATFIDRNDSRDVNKTNIRSLATPFVHLNDGEVNLSFDLGLVAKSNSITSTLFIDKNGNHKFDAKEKAVAGATIRLYRWVDVNHDRKTQTSEMKSAPDAIVRTDAKGNFAINGIASPDENTYFALSIDAPRGYGASKNGTSSWIDSIGTTTFRFHKLSAYKKFVAALNERQGSVSGTMWADTIRNGRFDRGEHGVSHINVRLVSSTGKTYRAVTNHDGSYTFKKVAAGKYFVGVDKTSLPTGYFVGAFGNDDIKESIAGRKDITLTVKPGAQVSIPDLILSPQAELRSTAKVSVSGKNVHTSIALKSSGSKVVSTTSDAQGNFIVSSIIPGPYDIDVAGVRAAKVELVPGRNIDQAASPSDSPVDNVLHGRFSKFVLQRAQFNALRGICRWFLMAGLAWMIAILIYRRKIFYPKHA